MSCTTSSGEVPLAGQVEDGRARVRAGQDKGAWISSPLSRVTPLTRPALHVDRVHRRAVRIVAPEASALRAIAIEMAPMPPRTWPHSPLTPSSSPSAWWSRLYAVPGVRGPAQTPTTPVEAQAPLRTSDSNHSSSRSPTDIVITRNSSSTSRRESSRAARLAKEREQVAGALRAERGRRPQHQRAQEAGHPREHLLELRVARGVARREPGDRLARPLSVVEEEDRDAVGRDRPKAGSSGIGW